MTCYVDRKPNNGFVYPHNTISPLVIRVCYSLMGTSGISRCLKHRFIELQRESLQQNTKWLSLTNQQRLRYITFCSCYQGSKYLYFNVELKFSEKDLYY